MNEDMIVGAITALQEVKEEMNTIVKELDRKGLGEPKGFSALRCYVDDRIRELKTDI